MSQMSSAVSDDNFGDFTSSVDNDNWEPIENGQHHLQTDSDQVIDKDEASGFSDNQQPPDSSSPPQDKEGEKEDEEEGKEVTSDQETEQNDPVTRRKIGESDNHKNGDSEIQEIDVFDEFAGAAAQSDPSGMAALDALGSTENEPWPSLQQSIPVQENDEIPATQVVDVLGFGDTANPELTTSTSFDLLEGPVIDEPLPSSPQPIGHKNNSDNQEDSNMFGGVANARMAQDALLTKDQSVETCDALYGIREAETVQEHQHTNDNLQAEACCTPIPREDSSGIGGYDTAKEEDIEDCQKSLSSSGNNDDVSSEPIANATLEFMGSWPNGTSTEIASAPGIENRSDTFPSEESDSAPVEPTQTLELKLSDGSSAEMGNTAPTSESIEKKLPEELNGDFDDAVPVANTNDVSTPLDCVNTALDASALSPAPEPVKEEAIDDPFGDFNSVPSSESKKAQPLPSSEDKEVDDSLGDFGSVAAETQLEQEALDDSFGDFNNVSSSESKKAESLPSPEDNQVDESFGDVGSAPAETSLKQEAIDDSFGDFNNVPSSESKKAVSLPSPEDNQVDESFGDFGSAPAETSLNQEAIDDSFGDFSNVSSSESKKAEPLPSSQDNEVDESFGDFGRVPHAPGVSSERLEKEDTKDTYNETRKADALSAPDDNELDESFGDFDSADAPPSTQEPAAADTDTDDSFGNFNKVPSSEAKKVAPLPSSGKNEIAESFCDFDKAEASSEAAASKELASDFGDFSSFSAPLEVAPVEDSISSKSRGKSDPLLEKTRIVFSKVFQKDAFTDFSDDEGEESQKVKIESILSCVVQEQQEKTDNKLDGKLKSILKELNVNESPSRFVVDDEKVNLPNAHFTVSLGGLYAVGDFDGPLRRQIHDSDESSRHNDITASTNYGNKDYPRSSQSQQTARSTSKSRLSQQSARLSGDANTSSMPKAEEPKQEAITEKCRQLLKQIPDLSFMLQSKILLSSGCRK